MIGRLIVGGSVPGFATVLALALAMLGCGSSGEAPAIVESAPDAGEPTATIAEMLLLDHLSIYQGVKTTLVESTLAITPNAPVVPGRPGLLRAHLKSKVPRAKLPKIVASLRVTIPGLPDLVLEDGPRTVLPIDDLVLSSSFNFELPETALVQGAALSITFRDASGADTTTTRYPAEGTMALPVGALAPTLRVKFVPVRYDSDGSKRLPKLDDAIVEMYRTALYKMYPTSKVEITVRDPLAWPLEVQASGKGWDSLLDAVIETREDDASPDDVYYVGVFTPAESQAEYCSQGCVLGMAPQTFLSDVGLRVAMVVGYHDRQAAGTLAQELAHAMGRGHAPCGVSQALDFQYPYGRANIGVPGYDILEKKIIDPNGRVFDFMSYCSPVWVSDYTFKGIYERMVDVEAAMRGSTKSLVQTWKVTSSGDLVKGAHFPILDDGVHDPSGYRSFGGAGGGLIVAPDRAKALAIAKDVARSNPNMQAVRRH